MNLELWKKIKKEKKLTIEQIAKAANLPKGSVQNIFCGYVPNPRSDTVEAIERALGLYTSPRTEKDPVIIDEVELNGKYPIRLLGSVVAGVPIEAQEDLEGYIYIDYRPSDEYFAVRVHGDSMINAGIPDRAILVVHKQESAECGEIVVAMLNREQTVKRFKIIAGSIFLMPENKDYDPIPVTDKDELIILGKVVEVRFSL